MAEPVADDARVHRALSVGTRARIYAYLRGADGAVTISELAAVCGVHANTVRDHMGELIDAALVEKTPAEGDGVRTRGRPPVRYRACVEPAAVRSVHAGVAPPVATVLRELQRLAVVLAEGWATPAGPDSAAHGVGGNDAATHAARAWGRDSGETIRTSAGAGLTPARVVSQVLAMAGGRTDVRQGDVRVPTCPFAQVARDRPEVVCPLHQAMLDGALEAALPPGTVVSTSVHQPAGPGSCVVTFHSRLATSVPVASHRQSAPTGR